MARNSSPLEVIRKALDSRFVNVEREAVDRWTVRHGSTRVFISVGGPSKAYTVINLYAPVLTGVHDSPELYRWVALLANDYVFGHVHLEKWDNGTLVLGLAHRLLGDYLDEAEIYSAVECLGTSADDLDDILQPRFGGSRLHEE